MGFDAMQLFVVGSVVLSVFIFLYTISSFLSKKSTSGSRDVSKVLVADKDASSANIKRRKALREAIQNIEVSHKKKTGNTKSLSSLISYSGLPISKEHYYIGSCVLAFVCCVVFWAMTGSLFVSFCISISCSLVMPRLFLKYVIKKRVASFLEEFPNALDIIVRSVRTGLPVSDAISVIVSQSSDPVRSEFRRVVEARHLGLSVSESVSRMIRYMPLQEVSFFATVISVQAQLGGNLSEALSNLSRILRERKKMKAKVQALSMEAKASAWIIGSLPFFVSLLVHFTSPEYIGILITDPRGHMILGVAAFLMVLGIMIMRIMINFDI
ncbi:type II secretion system F family protein [Candidatus Liberibacter africanus]|uniref:Pilus assembly protein n=1 Tax=Candidatus Liberibacter africanus PTSAPSY TaxID=1277257 RepID=A0A0G3I472_LIBAF|nr:type II secretion system F family protein [Candidatus Liberibacter africanus]AKK20020.1 pilus assembly protein [Candidatus Liberibacter africanus PTSAPSY]QTP63848.1 type II secretion system F family protein [Candidatus Liberibacter africanus]